ncbi:MAG: glycosyltransferase [Euryarchaeota archaeon]|nr:glycosyltransferase [Euryarchaeota archaeon]
MRIALLSARRSHTPPDTFGGTERAVDILGRALARAGHEVVVWAREGSKGRPDYATRPYLKGSFRDDRELAGFDVVHNHWIGDDNWTGYRFIERLLRAHPRVVQTYHGSFPYYVRPYSLWLRMRRRAPHFIVQSTRHVAYAHRHGIPNCRFIPNAIAEFAFHAQPEDYVAYVGRLAPEKGVATAIRVAKKAGVRLRIAGPGDPAFLKREVRPHLSSNVEYLGVVSDADRTALLQRAQALVFPSRYGEGMPLVVLEALACGTPVVSSDAYWSAPDVVREGVSGFLAADEDGLAAALGRIKEIDRARCFAWAKERFAPEAVAVRHMALYQELAEKTRNPRGSP